MTQCSIAGCDKAAVARTWCSKHYARWHSHGSADVRLPGDVLNGCRVCVGCNADKPVSEFAPKRATCKACIRRQERAKHAANREARNEASRRWRTENPELSKQLKRDWYYRNKDRSQAASLAWRESHPERAKEARKAWEAANPDYRRIWANLNRDKAREYGLRWREQHPEQATEMIRARRALIKAAALSQNDLDRLWTGICGICKSSMDRSLPWPDPMSKSIDHIVPLSQGGTHTRDNLQWAHLVCNIRKGAKMVD